MDHLITLILSLPLIWKIIFISILVISNIVYIFRKPLFSSKLWGKITGKDICKVKLRDHKLFTESSFLIHNIKRINLDSPKKTEIFQQLLLVKYDVIKKNAFVLIENSNIYDLSNKQFYALVIKNMTTIVDEYNEKMKFRYGEKLHGLIMTHPEKGFNNIHERSIVWIKSVVQETFESDNVVYSAPEEKIDFLLDLYHIAMKLAMKDVDTIYKNFNGDLDNLLKKCKKC